MEQIFVNMDPAYILPVLWHYVLPLVILIAAFVIHWLPVKVKDGMELTFVKMPLAAQAVIVAASSMLIYQSVTSNVLPFIYFQF